MSGVTLTIRLIRSFQHRNIKHVVIRDVDLDQTAEDLMNKINNDLKTMPGLPPPFRKFNYDTLKIQHKAHGFKTSDPVINTEDDEKLILDKQQVLRAASVENETELSYFNLEDYRQYQANPQVKW